MSKPIDALLPSDLATHPIWEFALDEEEGGDETYVRPVSATVVPIDSDHVVYHVACDVHTANGRVFAGFMSFCNGQLEDQAPIVVGGSDNYWCLDTPPFRKQRVAFEALFGTPYADVFPVNWALRIPVAGENSVRTGRYGGA
jgi:hypothetical protein